MSMGYEGYALLNVDGTEDLALCTGASVPRSRVRMESSAAYGGQINTPVPEIAIGSPETYDWDAYDGSMDVEVTQDFFDNQIKAWIFDRQKAAIVTLQSRAGNVQTFNNCYWNNISLSASDGGFVTASIGFVAMERDAYTIGGDYLENNPGPNGSARGNEFLCTPQSFGVPDPLNPSSDSNLIPIPYWNTKIEIDGSLIEFVTWTIDFSQEVVKFFSCENNANPVEPRFVAVGQMTAKISGDFIFLEDPTATFSIPDTLTTLDLILGADATTPSELKFENLELETATDALQSPESLVPIALEYAAYTIAV
jgi:hypothetical protein